MFILTVDNDIVLYFFNVDKSTVFWQDLGSRDMLLTCSWRPVVPRGAPCHFFLIARSRRPVNRFGRPGAFLMPTHRDGSI